MRLNKSEELDKGETRSKNNSFRETRVLEDMSDTTVPISEEEEKNADPKMPNERDNTLLDNEEEEFSEPSCCICCWRKRYTPISSASAPR